MTKNLQITLFIDPFTHHYERDLMFNARRDSFNGANILVPWLYLREWFKSRGIAVHTADLLLRGEIRNTTNVYVSFGIQNRYRKLARYPDVILSGYFAFESPIVEPTQYTGLEIAKSYFKRIFTFTESEALLPFLRSPLHSELFHLPVSSDSIRETLWHNEDRKFLVVINHNKVLRFPNNELYTERMRAVEFFSRLGDVDLYGVGWDGPSFRVGATWVPGTVQRIQHNLRKQWQRLQPDPLLLAARRAYRGAVADKLDVLSQYDFSLCFENMILKGWVTEKVFDCFAVGTVPIYWGAPDIETYVPADCFIDMRNFSDYHELRCCLKSLSKSALRRYRENGRDYLNSRQFRPFTKEAFVEILSRVVQEDTGVQLS